MGLLVDGVWQDKWYDTKSSGGRFERQESSFRHWLGSDSDADFPAQPNRYHLYVSYACPWAHRTLVLRKLKGLEDTIGVSVVHPVMGEHGWTFDEDFPGATGDDLHGQDYLHRAYTRANPNYTGRVTVPVLWDSERDTIVNNESAEIIRMLNSAFDAWGRDDLDFYPESLRNEIDGINAFIYDRINNGVYKTGFASTQEAYDEAVNALFEALDQTEERLSRRRYLVGEQITEADWRLFTTLIRFDPVYVGHFKCNKRCLREYPNLWGYTRELYQVPGVADTVHMDHITHHYHASHDVINPTRIVPIGPELDYNAPVDRDQLGPQDLRMHS